MAVILRITDTVLAVYNDMHSGSPVAPFPPGQWEMRGANVSQNALQKILYQQLVEASAIIGRMRKGKRLVVVNLGDAVEGIHHESQELTTTYRGEMERIHIELMDTAMKKMRFGRGDRLYYVAGTPSHAGESEERVAKDLGAIPYSSSRAVWPVLNLRINGVDVFLAHHGPSAGRGANKGNGLRTRLRNLYYERLDAGKPVPRLVIFADKHERFYERFWRDGTIMDGFISPAFQAKTDYVYKILPEALTNIGALVIPISASGEVQIGENFLTIEVEQDRVEAI